MHALWFEKKQSEKTKITKIREKNTVNREIN